VLLPVGIDAVHDRVEPVYTRVLGLEVVQADSVGCQDLAGRLTAFDSAAAREGSPLI
jgi:hypothetical protein